MKSFNLIKKLFLQIIIKKITKYSFEIIKNIELLYFINPDLITTYDKFLKSKLKEEKEIQLYNYLYKNWISKNSNYYNY